MRRAWMWGVVIVLAMNGTFMGLLPRLSSRGGLYVASTLVWLSWVAAGYVAAAPAPRNKLAVGTAMAVPAAVALAALNELAHVLDQPTDLSGVPGLLFLATVGLFWITPFAAAGAVAGRWISTRTPVRPN